MAAGGLSEQLAVLALVSCLVSGVIGFCFDRSSRLGQRLAAALAVAGCLVGLGGVAVFWSAGPQGEIAVPWPVPGGEIRLGVDGLSALYLAPVFLIGLAGSIYGLDYWSAAEHPTNARRLRLFYGSLLAGMVLVATARNGLLFLLGWELMALSAFFLVATEDEDAHVRQMGWIFLAAAHLSTLCLFGMFALLWTLTGSFAFDALPGDAPGGIVLAIFVLALVGFGLKAGLMPLHVWLPGAHAAAPSHVSAILSGVVIKMGIYGIVRVTSLLPQPPVAWGCAVMVLGVVSGVLGVVYAIGQHDLKRLLAYHSIENIGIIAIGIGLALVGRSAGRADWVALGLGGGLLHVWNHALFKSLLFFSAGAAVHATGTREIDHLGGLGKRMPGTAACFLIGAIAICGLPPLNGFVSELLIYLGLFRSVGVGGPPAFAWAGFAVAALAMIGALAVACFVKVFGAVFLGSPRSAAVEAAHDPGFPMIAPMLVLVLGCVAIGLAPALAAPALDDAIHAWLANAQFPGRPLGAVEVGTWAPLMRISTAAAVLLVGLTLSAAGWWWLSSRRETRAAPTWGCGYVAPNARMQYTASSFAQLLVGLFGWALQPRTRRPKELELFAKPAAFASDVPDLVLDRGVLPSAHFAAWVFGRLRVLHQGSIHAYLLYILVTLAVLLWL